MRRGSVMRERGQVLPFVIVFMLVLLVMLGLVIDVAQAYRARVALRASTDAAALAGAANLPNTASASSTAYAYGGSGKNPVPNVGAVSTNVQTSCTSVFPGCRPANTVSVTQSADVKTTFLRLLGFDKFHVQASASACSPCGAQPLDVMVVLDRTGSMCQFSNGAQDPSCSDLNNAKDGIRTFLQLMDPAGTKIGLAVLPPATSVGARCSTPAAGNYNAPGNPYVVVPLVNDYRSPGRCAQPELPAGVDGELHPRSRQHGLRQRHRGGPGRARPIRPARRSGHHRDAIRRRRQHGPDLLPERLLVPHPAVQPGSPVGRHHQGQQDRGVHDRLRPRCDRSGHQRVQERGVTNAIESPSITAYSALQQMASPGNFYNHPSPTDLSAIFQAIAFDINEGKSRLFN